MMCIDLKDEVTIFFHKPIRDFTQMAALRIATVTFKSLKSMSTGKSNLTSPEDFIPLLKSIVCKDKAWPRYLRISRTGSERSFDEIEVSEWVKQ
jgi:hypothetical protein